MVSLEEKEKKDEIEILSMGARISHTLNLVFFTLLVLTGIVLLSIETFAWIIYPIGAPLAPLLGLSQDTGAITVGAQVARAIHRFIGPLWGALLIAYGIYLIAAKKIRVFDPLRKPIRQQIREAVALTNHYAFGKPLPKDIEENLDRHNVLVSYLTIVLVIAFIMVGGSGAAIIYLNLTPEQHRIMLLIHDIGFYLSVLFTLAHIFATTHPANIPLLKAMFTNGMVPIEWAEKHMPLYLRKILGKKEIPGE
ncbi:MAG: cytochrome b/b6 domain-containing protein [Sulfolobales archaeon]